MVKWHKDWLLALHYLLERKGGYEIVRALLTSENNELIENEIVAETGGPESTIEEWLHDARDQGLVKSEVTDHDGKMVRIWNLDTGRIPPKIEPLIEARGKIWRDKNPNHGDNPNFSKWVGGPDLLNLVMSIEPDEEGYVSFENLDIGPNLGQ